MKKIKPILCLCLAGLGSRFTTVGYKTPKYLLPTKDNTSILQEILHAFRPDKNQKTILILNTRNKEWDNKITDISNALNLPIERIYTNDTKGQAETAQIATQCIHDIYGEDTYNNTPIIFHNGDTVLYERNLEELSQKLYDFSGVIDTFPSDSAAYSYVKIDNDNLVIDMAEKVVISNHASTGLYGFSNARMFNQAYNDTDFNGEMYISAIYNTLLNQGKSIYNSHSRTSKDTVILGTPQEYEAYLNNVS